MNDPHNPLENDASDPTSGDSQRLAKRIARAGLCSRRDAERWIEDGRVTVNGKLIDSPALNVGPEDIVVVDGKPLPEAQVARLWRYNKPPGLVVTAKDEKGRANIFERLPPEMPRVVSIGRLDLNSEGLLLLTNDGDLARRLELPATGWIRRYRVRVHGYVSQAKLDTVANGVTVEGIRYGEIRAELESQKGANAWVSVSLTEGKNREVRKVMEFLDYPVNRLIRVAYGPFQLNTLARGGVEEVSAKLLRDTVGGESRKGQAKWARAKPKPKQHKKPLHKSRNRAEVEPTEGAAEVQPEKPRSNKPVAAKPTGTRITRYNNTDRDTKQGSGRGAASKGPRAKTPTAKPSPAKVSDQRHPAETGSGGKKPGARIGPKREKSNADRRR
ncbi:MAG: pseudouridine synthase [Alphaproteobacteria bacterium]|nr:pseudouridine synthase [Alphaproteobacteria bacterium]